MSTAHEPGRTVAASVTRAAVEDFLFNEAQTLDEWRLEDWLAMFEPGARFLIPTTDNRDGDPASSQFFVGDDWDLLQARVQRLLSRNAHAENPRSMTHRLIGNVRLEPADDDVVRVLANFIVHRIRDDRIDRYLGHYDHLLVVDGSTLRFRRRMAVLEQQRLHPGGRLSFIL